MKRNISALAEKEYDLVVVGGGIFGICAAWDATLRGLSVALLEKGDFGAATSANCFKMVHGGIRYLQHGDIPRVRESSGERTALLRVAPHLVDPLPIVVPTYGNGMKGKAVLRAGAAVYDLVTMDRNRGVPDKDKRIPNSSSISRTECLGMFPGLDSEGLTGGTLIYDGHMYSPARLALSFLMSAAQQGAEVANYVEVTDFLRSGSDITGVRARDLLTDTQVDVRGKVVLNASGPWAEPLFTNTTGLRVNPPLVFSRDAALIINRRLVDEHAVALQSRTKDPDAKFSRGARHLFMIPWREYTQVGVWHQVHEGHPEDYTLTEEEVIDFLNEINESYELDDPLTMRDVSMANAGLILFGENNGQIKGDLSFGKRSRIVDHAKEHGVNRLISLVGVRYTTARGVGVKAIDMVFNKLGRKAPRSRTATTPIYGGRIDNFDKFTRDTILRHSQDVSPDAMYGILRNHGSEYTQVLKYIHDDPGLAHTVGDTKTIKAQIVQAVREEMAVKLGDVVFGRTDMGTGEHPGKKALIICANLMANELGWDDNRVKQEVEEVQAAFPSFVKEREAVHF